MTFISIKKAKKEYKNGVIAIHNLDMQIKRGEFVFIIGPSGSGKSTLIKMMYREEKPTKGSINIAGTEVGKLRNSRVHLLRRKIGIVFQDFKLLPRLTVYENVAFALEVNGQRRGDVRKGVLKALKRVGLSHKAKQYPEQLSGGEQQRVAIARAIVNEPKLLICDEPTGNLDPETSMEIMRVIEGINEAGTTVVMATHDMDIVNKLQKRVVKLKAGEIVHDEVGGYNETI